MILIERIPLHKENERPYTAGVRHLIGENLLYIYALVYLSLFQFRFHLKIILLFKVIGHI